MKLSSYLPSSLPKLYMMILVTTSFTTCVNGHINSQSGGHLLNAMDTGIPSRSTLNHHAQFIDYTSKDLHSSFHDQWRNSYRSRSGKHNPHYRHRRRSKPSGNSKDSDQIPSIKDSAILARRLLRVNSFGTFSTVFTKSSSQESSDANPSDIPESPLTDPDNVDTGDESSDPSSSPDTPIDDDAGNDSDLIPSPSFDPSENSPTCSCGSDTLETPAPLASGSTEDEQFGNPPSPHDPNDAEWELGPDWSGGPGDADSEDDGGFSTTASEDTWDTDEEFHDGCKKVGCYDKHVSHKYHYTRGGAIRIPHTTSTSSHSRSRKSSHNHSHRRRRRPVARPREPENLGGVAFGLIDYYADCDSSGNPILLAINMATTYHNIADGSNLTLSINWVPNEQTTGSESVKMSSKSSSSSINIPKNGRNHKNRRRDTEVHSTWSSISPASLPRMALIGHVEKLSPNEIISSDLPRCFLDKHGDALSWLPGNNVHLSYWARLVVDEVYWVGGFGDVAYIGWIPSEEWRAVTESEIGQALLPGELGNPDESASEHKFSPSNLPISQWIDCLRNFLHNYGNISVQWLVYAYTIAGWAVVSYGIVKVVLMVYGSMSGIPKVTRFPFVRGGWSHDESHTQGWADDQKI